MTFTVDAFPGETFVGEVGKIRLNATMTQNVVTYIVEVVTDNSGGRLLPYLTANLKFEVDRRDGVWSVPLTALEFRPADEMVSPHAEVPRGRKVWTRGADGLLVPVPVKTGLSDGIMYSEISAAGLSECEVVTGVETIAASASGGTSNPFTPAPPRRRNNSQQQRR